MAQPGTIYRAHRVRRDYTDDSRRQHDAQSAKRLELEISATAKTEEDDKLRTGSQLPSGLFESTPKDFTESCFSSRDEFVNESLPSPPPSPIKHNSLQQSSTTRRLLGKLRSDALASEANSFSRTNEMLSYREIVKERRRFASRQLGPTRIGKARLPMPVRFTDAKKRLERPALQNTDLPPLHKLSLNTEPVAETLAEKRFAERLLSPLPETFRYIPNLAKDSKAEPFVDHDARIDEIFNEKPPWSLELNTSMGEIIEAQKKARVSDEDRTREYITNLQLYDTRAPLRPLLKALSNDMKQRTASTVRANPDAVLAKAADSTPLRRHDFCRVIPHREWLNDEIVNGVLSWLDKAINHIGGVDDPKAQTRKCLVMTSFYYKQIKTACANTQRALRRKGITKENLLDVNTILLPICEHSHWTLMVICPSKRTVAHMDSLNPRGARSVTDLALAWMTDALGEKFVAEDWKTVRYDHPAQTNGYDCGVHTICNAICVAVGVNALEAYRAVEMPELRLQVSAVLVNGGFTGELDLLGL